ncbi:MAG: hypothetical protein LBL69_05955 [Zoogloeaceae bacterium]|jgi:hypothetical protein|nr:hypothetical protein [Zoogloeaceae bacterium]
MSVASGEKPWIIGAGFAPGEGVSECQGTAEASKWALFFQRQDAKAQRETPRFLCGALRLRALALRFLCVAKPCRMADEDARASAGIPKVYGIWL